MFRLIILAGVAGSGKSTYAEKLALEIKATIISSDKIRGEICGDETDQSSNDYIFREVIPERLKNAIKAGNCIYDATSVDRFSRKLPIRIGKEYKAQIECHYFEPNVEIAKKQNAARKRVVPIHAIEAQARRWQVPSFDEGFAVLFAIPVQI